MLYFQTSYANLASSVLACQLERQFPAGARFSLQTRKNKQYWYAFLPDGKTRYLGRDKPELREAIAKARMVAGADKENSAIIKALKSAGMPGPDNMTGKVLQDLSDMGLFRLRAVLVGTLAFQAYHAMFGLNPLQLCKEGLSYAGAEFKASSLAFAQTSDIDIAQFKSISVAVDDSLEASFAETLNKSMNFEAVPSLTPNQMLPKWRNLQTGLFVDLLTPFTRREDENTDYLPSLMAKAVKLKFLDFLIHDEMPAVLLHKSGVPVNVPQPEQFAIHKLIVAQERHDVAKREKDIHQGVILGGYLLHNNTQTFKEVFEKAWARGPSWRRRLAASLKSGIVPEKMRRFLENQNV